MDRNLFAAWDALPAPLVTDGGEAGAGADHGRRALRRALGLGADGAALSVRLSSDGAPVLFRLPRTGSAARGNVAVADASGGELRRLALKGGEPPLFLDEALELLPPSLPLLLWLRVAGSAAAVAPLLAAAAPRPVALLSGLREELLAGASVLPGLPRVLAAERPSLSDGAFCARHGLWVAAGGSSLTPIRCARLGKDGVSFLAHGVETAPGRDRALSLGARALLTRHLGRLAGRDGLPLPPPGK